MLMRPIISQKKTLTCTLAEAVWVADGSTIPASESTRWGRTLQASDFPTWSFQPESVVYIGKLFVSVYNISGSSQTISFRLYKNNSYVTNGSLVINNNQYGSFTANLYNVYVGDVLELAVWTASNSNVTVTGSLYHVVPTRLLPTSKPCIEVSYDFGRYTYPSPLSLNALNGSREYIGNSIINTMSSTTSRSYNGLSFVSQNNYNLFKYGDGDYGASNMVQTGSSTSSLITSSYYPTSISYRELRI